MDQRCPATGDDTLFNGGPGCRQGILDAVLLLFQLDFRRCSDVQHGDAPGELRKPFLELFPVIVTGGVLDLDLDLGDPILDVARLSRTVDDRGVLFLNLDRLGPAELAQIGVLELQAKLLADDLASGENRDIFQHRLSSITETGGFHCDDAENSPDAVHDQGRQRLSVDIFGNDQKGLARLGDFFKDGKKFLHVGDLLVVDQDEGVVQQGGHRVAVVREVGGQISPIELHSFDKVGGRLDRLGLFDGDHPVKTDFFHRVGDLIPDRPIVVGGDRGDLSDLFLVLDHLRLFLDLGDRILDRFVDSAAHPHRVDAGGNALHSFFGDRPSKDRGGGRSVSGDIVRLRGDFLQQLGAHVFEGILKLDLASDRDSVFCHVGGAELLVQDDQATFGAQCSHNGSGDLLHPVQQ